MWHEVGAAGEFPEKAPVLKRVQGKRILVVRVGEEFCAVSDICSHELAFLHEGSVVGLQIECPLHGARFDLRTGEAVSLPATEPIDTHPVRVRDGIVEVEVE